MRTDEERILAMHRRAAQFEKERRVMRSRLLGAGSVVFCLALVLGFAAYIPIVSKMIAPAEPSENMHASIFANSPVLGYIVTGLLAFFLGIAVTIFCYRLKKWQQEIPGESDERDADREERP